MTGGARATILFIDGRALGKDPSARPGHGTRPLTSGADLGRPCDRRSADLQPVDVGDLRVPLAIGSRAARRPDSGRDHRGRPSCRGCRGSPPGSATPSRVVGSLQPGDLHRRAPGAVRPSRGRRRPARQSGGCARKALTSTEPSPGAVRHRAGRAHRRHPVHQPGPRPRLAAGPLPPRDRRPPTRRPQPPTLRPRPHPLHSLATREGRQRPRTTPLPDAAHPPRVPRPPAHGAITQRPGVPAANGHPITARRYNTIFDRARTCLSWADRTPVSAHVLRHTAITALGRLAGYPVAQSLRWPRPIIGHRPLHASHHRRSRHRHSHPHQPTPPTRPDHRDSSSQLSRPSLRPPTSMNLTRQRVPT